MAKARSSLREIVDSSTRQMLFTRKKHVISKALDVKVFTLSIANMINQIIPKSLLAFSTFIAAEFGINDYQFSWIVNAYTIPTLVNMFVSGPVTTFYNASPCAWFISTCQLSTCILFLLQSVNWIQKRFYLIIAINLVTAFIQNIMFIYFTTVLATFSDDNSRGTVLSIFNSAWGWVTFLCPIIGLVLRKLGLWQFFLIFGLLQVLTIPFVFKIFPNYTLNEHNKTAIVQQLLDGSRTDLDKKELDHVKDATWSCTKICYLLHVLSVTMFLPILLLACFAAGMACVTFFFSVSRFLRDDYGLNPETAGSSLIAIGVAEILGAVLCSWYSRSSNEPSRNVSLGTGNSILDEHLEAAKCREALIASSNDPHNAFNTISPSKDESVVSNSLWSDSGVEGVFSEGRRPGQYKISVDYGYDETIEIVVSSLGYMRASYLVSAGFFLMALANVGIICGKQKWMSRHAAKMLLSLPCAIAYIFIFFLGWELAFNNLIVMFVEIGSLNRDSQSILLNSFFLLNMGGRMVGSYVSPYLYARGSFYAVAISTAVLALLAFALLLVWMIMQFGSVRRHKQMLYGRGAYNLVGT